MKTQCVLVFLAVSSFTTIRAQIEHNFEHGTKNAQKRLLQLARSELEDCKLRISDTRYFRIMYEESPYYEIGYVFGDVMERYRKLIEVVRRIRERKETLYHAIFHLETAQFLYMEIYHLTMMIHEIPRKWQTDPDFVDLKYYQELNVKSEALNPADQVRGPVRQAWFDEVDAYEREQRRIRRKMAQLQARLELLNQLANNEYGFKRPTNEQWPKDYGWEIDPRMWLNITQESNRPRSPGSGGFNPKEVRSTMTGKG